MRKESGEGEANKWNRPDSRCGVGLLVLLHAIVRSKSRCHSSALESGLVYHRRGISGNQPAGPGGRQGGPAAGHRPCHATTGQDWTSFLLAV
jgi:hypothetical protein